MSSRQNPKVRSAAALHKLRTRRKTGSVLLEGPRGLELALQRGVPVQTVFVRSSDSSDIADGVLNVAGLAVESGASVVLADDRAMAAVATTTSPPPIAAILDWAPIDVVPEVRWALCLDGVSDPGNLGTMVRSAAAFGVDAVIVGPGCADPSNPKALRASAGAMFVVPVVTSRDLGEQIQIFNDHGAVTVGAASTGGVSPTELLHRIQDRPRILVLGAEASGIGAAVEAAVRERVTIEMSPDVESLNVGSAAAILLFALMP